MHYHASTQQTHTTPTSWCVAQVSANHRLDDNEAEQQRILAQGGELAPVHYEDEGYVGALRVWPGGLAMSRTIGDLRAGDLVTAVPDVKRVGMLCYIHT